jgi:hypothetical protein
MIGRDPIDSLERHYARLEPGPDAGFEAAEIFARQNARTSQRIAGAVAFTAGLAAAALFLTWAAKPMPVNQSGAAAMARSQMIHSGLVQRDSHGWGLE